MQKRDAEAERSRCLDCGSEGKYLDDEQVKDYMAILFNIDGIFQDCSERTEIKRRIWHCEKCGRVWQVQEKEANRCVK